MKDFLELLQSIWEMVNELLKGDAERLANFKKIIEIPMQSVIFGSYSETKDYPHDIDSLSSTFTTIYEYVFVIAAIFITISFFTHIYELMYNEQLTMESFIKHVISVCLLFLLIGNGPVIVSYVYEFFDVVGEGIYDEIIAYVNADSKSPVANIISEVFGVDLEQDAEDVIIDVINSILENGVALALGYLGFAILGGILLSIITKLALAQNAIERALRFISYVILLPFAICQLYNQNGSYQLSNYLKHIGLLLLEQYVLLFEIMIIDMTLDYVSTGNLMPTIIVSIISFMLTIGAINSAKSRVQGIFY